MNAAFDHSEYRAFIASKGSLTRGAGFTPVGSWSSLFAHQRAALNFACESGRTACFLDTGLGKSRVEAAAAEEFHRATGRPSLILTPLAVARQMQRECAAVGVEARIVREAAEVGPGVNIANYERLPKLGVERFGGVVLDESSILKSFTGSTKRALVEAFADTPYRLAATATPAPNDHMEIGQHSEFLGVMPGPEMLTRWFVNDQTTMGGYRLKGHAEDAFWSWVQAGRALRPCPRTSAARMQASSCLPFVMRSTPSPATSWRASSTACSVSRTARPRPCTARSA